MKNYQVEIKNVTRIELGSVITATVDMMSLPKLQHSGGFHILFWRQCLSDCYVLAISTFNRQLDVCLSGFACFQETTPLRVRADEISSVFR